MNKDELKIGKKVLVEVEIKRLAGEHIHVMIGNKVVSVPTSMLK